MYDFGHSGLHKVDHGMTVYFKVTQGLTPLTTDNVELSSGQLGTVHF